MTLFLGKNWIVDFGNEPILRYVFLETMTHLDEWTACIMRGCIGERKGWWPRPWPERGPAWPEFRRLSGHRLGNGQENVLFIFYVYSPRQGCLFVDGLTDRCRYVMI